LITFGGFLLTRIRLLKLPIFLRGLFIVSIIWPLFLPIAGMQVGQYSGIVWLWGFIMKGVNVFDPWGPLYIGFYLVFVMLFIFQFAAGMVVEGSGKVLILDKLLGIAGVVTTLVAAVGLLYQAVGVLGTIFSPIFVILPAFCYATLLIWKCQTSPRKITSSGKAKPEITVNEVTV
jgi:hypothetical protein